MMNITIEAFALYFCMLAITHTLHVPCHPKKPINATIQLEPELKPAKFYYSRVAVKEISGKKIDKHLRGDNITAIQLNYTIENKTKDIGTIGTIAGHEIFTPTDRGFMQIHTPLSEKNNWDLHINSPDAIEAYVVIFYKQ